MRSAAANVGFPGASNEQIAVAHVNRSFEE